ncbi:MAG: phosphoglycolate phosphatase [Parvibaculaceae bacterium]|jgi:phosphoglycolate phosphatase
MNVLLQRHGRPTVPIERVRHLVGGGARLLMERGFKETGEPASEALLDQLFQEFLVHYGDHVADHSEVWPGLRDQLDRLQEMGIPMAVCTNKVEELSHKALAALDLAKYFPVVIGGDTLPVKKPDPEHLLAAVRQLGGSPDNTIMVGDSDPDIDSARAAGIASICVSFGYARVPVADLKPTRIIDHFDDFPAALKQLLPNAFASL